MPPSDRLSTHRRPERPTIARQSGGPAPYFACRHEPQPRLLRPNRRCALEMRDDAMQRRRAMQQMIPASYGSGSASRPLRSPSGCFPVQPNTLVHSRNDMLSRVAALIFVALAAGVGQFSPLRAEQSIRLTDLTIAKAERMVFEGQNGIKITFAGPSAERVRQFTRDFVGCRIVVLVNQRRLATCCSLPS